MLAAGVVPTGVVTGSTDDLGTEIEGTMRELEAVAADEMCTEAAGTVLAATGSVEVEPGVQSKPTL